MMEQDDDKIVLTKDQFRSLMQSLRDENASILENKIKELEMGIIDSLKRETAKLVKEESSNQPKRVVVPLQPSNVIKHKAYKAINGSLGPPLRKGGSGGVGIMKRKKRKKNKDDSTITKTKELIEEESEESEEEDDEEELKKEIYDHEKHINQSNEKEDDHPRVHSAPFLDSGKKKGGEDDDEDKEGEEEDFSIQIFGEHASSLLKKSKDMVMESKMSIKKKKKKTKKTNYKEIDNNNNNSNNKEEAKVEDNINNNNNNNSSCNDNEIIVSNDFNIEKVNEEIVNEEITDNNKDDENDNLVIEKEKVLEREEEKEEVVFTMESKEVENKEEEREAELEIRNEIEKEEKDEDKAKEEESIIQKKSEVFELENSDSPFPEVSPLFSSLPPLSSPSAQATSLTTSSNSNSFLDTKFRNPITSLGDREWENEIARNIITLYRANVLDEKGREENATETSPPSTPLLSTTKLPALKSPKIETEKKKKNDKAMDEKKKKGEAKALQLIALQTRFIPKMIWFSGSGLTRAVWCGLAVKHQGGSLEKEFTSPIVEGLDCRHKLCNELSSLERNERFRKYLALVEGLLQAHVRIFGTSELEKRQWRQLIVSCNVFSQKSVEAGKFGLALELLQKAESLAQDDIIDDSKERLELKSFIEDAYSYYYYKRNKTHASLQYAKRATITHSKLGQWEHVAKCNLHQAAILAKMSKHDDCVRILGSVLSLVENEKLEVGGATAQKICMIAVTYHNIAASQLILEKPHEACVSSQNARRLARLSLSYSNKWLKQFEATHAGALSALSNDKEIANKFPSVTQANLFSNLTAGLFS